VKPLAKQRKDASQTTSPVDAVQTTIELSRKRNTLPYDGVLTDDAGGIQSVNTEHSPDGSFLLSGQQMQCLQLSDLYQPIVRASGSMGNFADIAAWNIIHKLSCAGILNLSDLNR
jgi:hypothetical protein